MAKKFDQYINKAPSVVWTPQTSPLPLVRVPQNYFLLSSSMDKTVRLWHISRRECLCCFQHIDFVTAIAFHPRVSAGGPFLNSVLHFQPSLHGKWVCMP